MEDGSKARVVEDRVQRWYLQVLAVLREMPTLPREEDKDGQKLKRDGGAMMASLESFCLSTRRTVQRSFGAESRGDMMVWSGERCVAKQKAKLKLKSRSRVAAHRRLDRAVESHNGRGRCNCSWASERTRSQLQPVDVDTHLDPGTATLAQLCRSQ